MNPYAVYFAVLLVALLIGIASFEVLVNRLYTHHPNDWKDSGEPATWNSGIKGIFRGSASRWRLNRKWLTRTPNWVRSDPTARLLIIAFRIAFAIFNFGLVGFIILALLLS